MPGIGYVEPYQVVSIVFINKTDARNKFCMPGIGMLNHIKWPWPSIVFMN